MSGGAARNLSTLWQVPGYSVITLKGILVMPNRWFAAVLGFLFQPLAFVYLAKLKWALFYFLASIVLGIADFYLEKKSGYSGLVLMLAIGCCIHAFKASANIEFGDNRKWYSKWWGVVLIPVVFISSVFTFRAFFYEPFKIPSLSMSPTLKVGDHIIVSKYGYGLYGSFGITVYSAEPDSRKKPKRGEIFALYPPNDGRIFVERIIGLPNDIVEFSDKQLYINDSKVETTRIDNSDVFTETLDGNTYSVQYIREVNQLRNFKVKVPENSYFVMGDNRDNSADSRVWGMVPGKNIIGKVVLIW